MFRLTESPAMTIADDLGRKATKQTKPVALYRFNPGKGPKMAEKLLTQMNI